MRRLRAGGGGAQPRRAGLCRQPAAVRPAARSTAYRPQRHRFPEVVDQVMRASLGRRYAMVGPLEAADMTGLATVQDICQHLLPELASGTEMMSLVAEKVARGDTGARSGQGFTAGTRPGTSASSRAGNTSCASP